MHVDLELRALTALQSLGLARTDLSTSVRLMLDLGTLNLAHNPIQALPEGLWGLSLLEALDTTGCDIHFPPPSVISEGVKPLLQFQRMIERGRYTSRLDLSAIGFHALFSPFLAC